MNLKTYIKEFGILMTIVTGSTRLLRKTRNRKWITYADGIKHRIV